MQRYKIAKPNVPRNVSFVSEQMALVLAVRPQIDELISDVIFWGKPQYSLIVLKVAVPLGIMGQLGIFFFPIRYAIAVGLWLPALAQIEFFKVLIQAVSQQVVELDY